MIGVDIESNADFLVLVDAVIGRRASYCFSKSASGSTVKNAHWLASPLVDRHRCGEVIVSHICEFDSKMIAKRISSPFVDFIQT